MSYALVKDSAIQKVVARPPDGAQRLDNQMWVLGLPTADVALQQACGYYVVDGTAVKPADTEISTFDSTVALVVGVPKVVWIERPWTAEEETARTRDINSATTQTDLLSTRSAQEVGRTQLNDLIVRVDTLKSAPITTLAEARTVIRDLAQEVKNLAQGQRAVLRALNMLIRAQYGGALFDSTEAT